MQRVSEAAVRVDEDVVGEVGNGLLVLLGVGPNDDEATATRLADKVRKLRVFEDARVGSYGLPGGREREVSRSPVRGAPRCG